MLRSFKYRLFPNPTQAAGLTDMLGSFCDLYNACLQQRIEAYRRRGKSLGYIDQANELKAVRATDERLAVYSYSAEQQVVRRLDKAFRAFFGRLRRGKGGFPRFRARSMFDSADFRVGDGLTIRRSRKLGIVGIPGEIKVRWHRELPEPGSVPPSSCGQSPIRGLNDRIHDCPGCGTVEDRDVHAAKVIKHRAFPWTKGAGTALEALSQRGAA